MNLLDDPVFTIETSTGIELCTLPRIYALLSDDAVESFVKLQAHQKQAWHCFLAQLGAIATEDRDLPATEAGWRNALAVLTVPEAWNLYTEDLSKPAFMQPPVPENTIDVFRDSKGQFQEVDVAEYDIPVLSKNHALKINRVQQPSPEHWVYMLANVQTAESGWGRGKYPTSRMNGGYGTRAFFTTTPSLRLGEWIMYDIKRLHKYKSEVVSDEGYKESIHPLLWTIAWDGSKEEIDLEELHPWYIDCCRRIRRIKKMWVHTGTKGTRVGGVINGQTGDPWIPVDNDDNKILMPSRKTFRYDRLWKVLFDRSDYKAPFGFTDVGDGYVVCRTLIPNDTEREYNLERIMRFSARESSNPFDNEFDSNDSKDEISAVAWEAEDRVQKASEAVSIFSQALGWLFCKDPDERKHNDILDTFKNACNRQVNALHARIDQRFFDRLFEAPDLDDEERLTFWETILVKALRTQFNQAKELCPNKHRWKRLAKAQSIFDNQMKSAFTYANQYENESAYA